MTTKDSKTREKFIVTPAVACPVMPEGMKYSFFNKQHDSEEGVDVIYKGVGGLYRGTVTDVPGHGVITINDMDVLLVNVLYKVEE